MTQRTPSQESADACRTDRPARVDVLCNAPGRSPRSGPATLSPDIRLFFNFVKAAGITGIFGYHLYNEYIGLGAMKTIFDAGILRYLFSNTSSLVEYLCATMQIGFIFGSVGVQFFIIASGFGLYFSHLSHAEHWLLFFRKRMVRIIPLYYFVLLCGFLVKVYVLQDAPPARFEILARHFFLIHTLNDAYLSYGAFYFVGVICQLYLLFPVITIILRQRHWKLPFFAFTFFLSFILKTLLSIAGMTFSGILVSDYLPYFVLGMLIADSVADSGRLHLWLFDMRVSVFSVLSLIGVLFLLNSGVGYSDIVRTMVSFLLFLSLPLFFRAAGFLRATSLINALACSAFVFFMVHMIYIRAGLHLIHQHGLYGSIGSYLHWIPLGLLFFLLSFFTAHLLQRGYDRISAPKPT